MIVQQKSAKCFTITNCCRVIDFQSDLCWRMILSIKDDIFNRCSTVYTCTLYKTCKPNYIHTRSMGAHCKQGRTVLHLNTSNNQRLATAYTTTRTIFKTQTTIRNLLADAGISSQHICVLHHGLVRRGMFLDLQNATPFTEATPILLVLCTTLRQAVKTLMHNDKPTRNYLSTD